MFARKNRFSFKNKLPKNIFNSEFFTLRYEKNEDQLKVAVIVSKRVDKRATARNRVKRVMLEAVRKNLSPETNLNLIFYAKKNALNAKDLKFEIKSIINKIE